MSLRPRHLRRVLLRLADGRRTVGALEVFVALHGRWRTRRPGAGWPDFNRAGWWPHVNADVFTRSAKPNGPWHWHNKGGGDGGDADGPGNV